MDKKRLLKVFLIANIFYFGVNYIFKFDFLGPFTYIGIVGGLTEIHYDKSTGGAYYLDGSITGAKYLAISSLYLFLRHVVNQYFGISLPV